MSEISATRDVTITNPQGLHARPAEMIARTANNFESKVELLCNGLTVDAKSILHILTMAAVQGTDLTISAQGSDAEAAVKALGDLVDRDFAAAQSN
jgi:phosphotransferase system HPr (HPr) family protein